MAIPPTTQRRPAPSTLNLPSYHHTDPASGKTYTSVVFKSCAIDTTVQEILLINRGYCKAPLMYIETPLDIWEQQEILGHLERCLPWQPANVSLVDSTFIQFYGLEYEPPLVCYGQSVISPADQTLIFRPCTVTAADKVLIKSVWKLPHIEDQPDDNAYHHEHSIQRFNDKFIDTATQRAGALHLYRVASEYYPLGVDYWLFTLQPSADHTIESAKTAFITTPADA